MQQIRLARSTGAVASVLDDAWQDDGVDESGLGEYLQREFSMTLRERATAELLAFAIANVDLLVDVEVRGRDLATGRPKSVRVPLAAVASYAQPD